jgi:lipopolysaccharide cholinephosphotransferase
MLSSQNYTTTLSNISKVLYQPTNAERIQLQNCILTIYEDLKKVCDKYNLLLIMGGGSALGTVRHKGFIPWDDDMDIIMSRSDYEKLKQVFFEELSDKYEMSCPNTNDESKGYYMQIVKKNTTLVDLQCLAFGKYKGVWIDILPIDYASNSHIIRIISGLVSNILAFIANSMLFYLYDNKLQKEYFSLEKRSYRFYKFRKFVGRIFSIFFKRKSVLDRFDRFAFSTRKQKFSTIAAGRKHYLGEVLPSDVFYPPKKDIFENQEVYLPNNYDLYLKNLYGNYMSIPPEDKRERHKYVLFDLEK